MKTKIKGLKNAPRVIAKIKLHVNAEWRIECVAGGSIRPNGYRSHTSQEVEEKEDKALEKFLCCVTLFAGEQSIYIIDGLRVDWDSDVGEIVIIAEISPVASEFVASFDELSERGEWKPSIHEPWGDIVVLEPFIEENGVNPDQMRSVLIEDLEGKRERLLKEVLEIDEEINYLKS